MTETSTERTTISCSGDEYLDDLDGKDGSVLITNPKTNLILKEILIVPLTGRTNSYLVEVISSLGFAHAKIVNGPYWISLGPNIGNKPTAHFHVNVIPEIPIRVFAKFG